MAEGPQTTDLPAAGLIDEVLGNREVSPGVMETARQSLPNLATQLASSGAIATVLGAQSLAIAVLQGATGDPGAIADLTEQIAAAVPQTRTVVGAGLAQGGGALSADRTITVPASTLEEALDGTRDDVALAPKEAAISVDRKIIEAGKETSSQYLVVPGGPWSEADADEENNIASVRRASTGGLLTAVENIEWVSQSGSEGGASFVIDTLMEMTEVWIDDDFNIGMMQLPDGTLMGAVAGDVDLTEVYAARGSQPNLNARISRGLSPAGDALTALQHPERLRRTHSVLASLYAGVATQLPINVAADSWGDVPGFWLAQLRARLLSTAAGGKSLGNAGSGYIGFASAAAAGTAIHGSADQAITVTRSGAWTDVWHSADGVPGTASATPDGDLVTSDEVGAYIRVTNAYANDTFTLVYMPGGSVEISWDDGVSYTAAIDLSSGEGLQSISIERTANSVLRIRVASAGVQLSGMFAIKTASGVFFNKWASAGSSSLQWSVIDQTNLAAAWALSPATLFIFMLGANDAKFGQTPEQVAAHIATLIATARVSSPGCDVLVVCQPDLAFVGTPSFEMHELSPVLRKMAAENDAAFIDLQESFGPVAPTAPFYAAYSGSSATPLLDPSDNRHPNHTGSPVLGANVIADTILRALFS